MYREATWKFFRGRTLRWRSRPIRMVVRSVHRRAACGERRAPAGRQAVHGAGAGGQAEVGARRLDGLAGAGIPVRALGRGAAPVGHRGEGADSEEEGPTQRCRRGPRSGPPCASPRFRGRARLSAGGKPELAPRTWHDRFDLPKLGFHGTPGRCIDPLSSSPALDQPLGSDVGKQEVVRFDVHVPRGL